MRTRATVAAVTGALALSALAVPAAQADDSSRAGLLGKVQSARAAQADSGAPQASGRAAAAADGTLNVTFSGVKINKGKSIVVGTSKTVTVPTAYTVTHPANVDIFADDFRMAVAIYRGAFSAPDNFAFGASGPVCAEQSATVAVCEATVDVIPDGLFNTDATTWKAAGFAFDYNGQNPDLPEDEIDWENVDYAEQGGLASTKLQRYSKLTANASPEPVKKGKTITVTGKLTRANWDTLKYAGYTNQSVKLQFKKKGTSSYTTIKTVTTDSSGNLKTTRTASVDGYWRWSFAGTSNTPAVTSKADYVDVQ
ncbi:hypothetical protein [Streptomyces sp. GC420]|uniref:hypothetical protein n=1 Tax=Streptomyces sp. GC420 TaxID=2697568 RepID=UPI0014150D77|nr:hypothetical protein [Streptomyces sp. GC420]NBM16498.1 hypothetical protein [Streptomyces sp. GC420]